MATHLINPERAETIGLQALAFLLSSQNQLERFMDETGFAPGDIKANAQSPALLEAVLTVLVNDESFLLSFAANAGLAPEEIIRAHDHLSTSGGRARPLSST